MNELRIDVADLLTHPAARRPVRVTARVEDLGAGGARIVEPVELDLLLERVPDGIVARGQVHAHFDAECGTCLRPVGGDLDVEVSELFEEHPVDGETYPTDGDHVDLEQLVRDALLLELPLAPACDAADPGCVADAPAFVTLDDDPDPSSAPLADPRWAALSQLEL
ncbi:MAG TPA: YceD family protein [Acidimicrobiia bacterium]|nr:YceD family protein [Acidimicrobiia bacterium]